MRISLVCALPWLWAVLLAQAPYTTPDDMKAYSEAVAVKDPQKRIEAIEEYIAEYPESAGIRYSLPTLAEAIVKTSSEDKAKFSARAEHATSLLKGTQRALFCAALGQKLNEAKILPDEAERYARQALSFVKWKTFQAEERAKEPIPTAEAIKLSFRARRAAVEEGLAKVYTKKSDSVRASRYYARALKDNPMLWESALALSEASEKAGKMQLALQQAAQARLARPSIKTRARFEELYRKNSATMNGSEEYLDSVYKKSFPPPMHAVPYRRSPQRSDRVVLAEVYTGAGCSPCLAVDLAFDVELERYSREDLAVVMYHQHIPRPDPLSNNYSADRWKFQQGRGVPTYVIDGAMTAGGGSRDNTPEIESKIQALIEKRLIVPARATLAVDASLKAGRVHVKTAVDGVQNGSADLKLQVLLVEKVIRYSGENGIRFHPMVVRSMAGFPLDGAKKIEYTFDLDKVAAELKAHIDAFELKDARHNTDGKFRFAEKRLDVDAAQLAVVVFVQDQKSKEILQSIYRDVRR
jgi:tetratricopeptide (TPR) repeat protein